MKYDNLFARLSYCLRCAGGWLLYGNGKCPVCEYCRVCDNLTELVNGKCPHGHSEEEHKRLVDAKNGVKQCPDTPIGNSQTPL